MSSLLGSFDQCVMAFATNSTAVAELLLGNRDIISLPKDALEITDP